MWLALLKYAKKERAGCVKLASFSIAKDMAKVAVLLAL